MAAWKVVVQYLKFVPVYFENDTCLILLNDLTKIHKLCKLAFKYLHCYDKLYPTELLRMLKWNKAD